MLSLGTCMREKRARGGGEAAGKRKSRERYKVLIHKSE